jgi:tRNA modification GTPase
MFVASDTIVAIATPPGRGGIGVVRLSGPDAAAVGRRLITHRRELEPRRATFTRTHGVDQVVVTYFPAPHSYTGEDVVELSAHGSPVVLRTIVERAMTCGARLAEPGEFTLRAFLNGRIDLTQAEAVADLIDSVTPLQARAAFDQLEGTLTRTIAELDSQLFDLIARLEASVDFPDEGYHFVEAGELGGRIDDLIAKVSSLLSNARAGRLVREGLQVAIVGRPNVGKSSLFNALVGSARAIVTDVPGTTRDLVTEVVDLDGLRVTLVDTAGLCETQDVVEAEGVARSRQAVDVADLVLLVVDQDTAGPIGHSTAQKPLGRDLADGRDPRHLLVQNKCDLGRPVRGIQVSAKTGSGLNDLRKAILAALDVDLCRDRPDITNVRHIELLHRADESLRRARAAALAEGGSMPEEFVLADLQEARSAFEEVTGRRAPEDLLAHIFSRFCIGK